MITQIISMCILLSGCYVEDGAYADGQKAIITTKFIGTTDNEKHYLRYDVAEAFLDLYSYAIKSGYDIKISSSYRTHHEQRRLRRKKKKLAAKAGYSKHQAGTAIDIHGTTYKCRKKKKCKSELYYWLKQNAPRYGFVNDVKGEPWHWSFIGQQEINLDSESSL